MELFLPLSTILSVDARFYLDSKQVTHDIELDWLRFIFLVILLGFIFLGDVRNSSPSFSSSFLTLRPN